MVSLYIDSVEINPGGWINSGGINLILLDGRSIKGVTISYGRSSNIACITFLFLYNFLTFL